MKCTLVILNYNDANRALELAMKCKDYQSIDKVVIVNNGSTDDSLIYLQDNLKNIENVILLNSGKNGGFAYGNNIGAKYIYQHLFSKYILFANTDTIFTNKSIEKCLIYLENDLNLGLVSMRIKNMGNHEEISCWDKRKYLDYFLANFYFYRTYIKPPLENSILTQPNFQYVDHVRGSFMLFNLSILKDINFFDENTFLYFEEEIISEKLKEKNYKIGIITDEFYIHNHIGLNNSNYLDKYFYNSLYYYLKTYCKIGNIKIFILKVAVLFKDFELKYIISPLKQIKKILKNILRLK